ncbi:hypothetical protein DSL72_004091 [Monilinia vaccinii-corymbosi]|uniref:Methyltransferase domain-containing protein n=1 Tax=Monilinia vaccinii-corymbosi TaxID=61207 RepID=A0A8A3NV43_9HELO|nr:hypothetical protein DSL72_004091 [Monilinia vaccinii-corymbosi]
MASLTLNIPQEHHLPIFITAVVLLVFLALVSLGTRTKTKTKVLFSSSRENSEEEEEEHPNAIRSFLRFFYASFLKPHDGDGTENGQQDALESFYRAQAGVYDATRSRLLRGREDMLALVAAQLLHRARSDRTHDTKRIWVDIGGGTGWNIEAMSEYVSVPEFFSSIYLVDFSPSLCAVARKRFKRLGWKNVKVVCQDARTFRLEDHEDIDIGAVDFSRPTADYFSKSNDVGGADLITLSYSLSMIPDFYSVIDSLANLLAPSGTIGVVDFYVQSIVDLSCRNYTGGVINRHVNWLGRLFWRAWFDVDRVNLEAGRRDYLEYRFGTVISADSRNYLLGSIPYYMWLGCQKKPASSSLAAPGYPHEIVERLDADATESPYLSPINHTKTVSRTVDRSTPPEIRSKAFEAAIVNLSANLPLPSFFYQNHHWRIHYDDQLKKHTQFKQEYIYAFTWEDTRVDERLLNITQHDVILAITSAGDNILSYALKSPRRIHAIDLNPNQNHLLELKVASLAALPYSDFWKLFGLGKHAQFRELLLTRLSPHLSSRAFQYWLTHAHIFTTRSRGLYETGGSRHAIRTIRLLSQTLGFRQEIHALLNSKTLNEQRETWQRKIRPIIMSRLFAYLIVSQETFLWKALGVPKNQLQMLEADYMASESAARNSSPLEYEAGDLRRCKGRAVWEYMVQTLDPVIETSLIGEDNPYYLVCLQGSYTHKCHPDYLRPRSHQKLSRHDAFDGLRIHTDEIDEVIQRITPGTLTIAVVMDSMDWFDPGAEAAELQIRKLNQALKIGGRVLLRSAALTPWYIATFENLGFSAKRVGARIGGACIDRVNMYASCYLLTKIEDAEPSTPRSSPLSISRRQGSIDLETLEI